MSAEAADAASTPAGSSVLVSQVVLDRMRDLPRPTGRTIAETIMQIPQRQGVPIRLNVPGDPPDVRYYALTATGAAAPVVIYRDALAGEGGRWVVTALMNQDAYNEYQRGLAEDAVVQGIAAAVAAGTVSMSSGITRPAVAPMGAISPDDERFTR